MTHHSNRFLILSWFFKNYVCRTVRSKVKVNCDFHVEWFRCYRRRAQFDRQKKEEKKKKEEPLTTSPVSSNTQRVLFNENSMFEKGSLPNASRHLGGFFCRPDLNHPKKITENISGPDPYAHRVFRCTFRRPKTKKITTAWGSIRTVQAG